MARELFLLALLALTIATVNLVAIWSVLGGGHWLVRLVVLVVSTSVLAAATSQFLSYVDSSYKTDPRGWRYYSNAWYGSLVRGIAEEGDTWTSWLWLNAALLAALLLFLRASGYRLMRTNL